MLAISVRLLHGTIRAGSPDDTVSAGGDPQGEWPPSPARLFSALVAADGTGARRRVTTGQDDLKKLESSPPPRILASDDTALTTLNPRFVVRDATADGIVHDYPARKAVQIHPGVKVSPPQPVVVYVWDDLELLAHELEDLRRRAARIGYLGCADSPVQVAVSTQRPAASLCEWRPFATAGVSLPVPYDGFLEALDRSFSAWSNGEPMRRSWVPTRRVRYSNADLRPGPGPGTGTTLWFEFDRRVAARRVLTVNVTLRAALLDRVDRYFDGEPGRRAPWQLHGHDIPAEVSTPYQLARCFSLANVGHAHSDGAIHGAAIWLPPDLAGDAVTSVRRAAGSIRELKAPGLNVRLQPRLGERGKWSTRPRRWIGPARWWFSATPVVAERGHRRGPDLEAVKAWFAHAGFPEPDAVRVSPVPSRPGVPKLRPREVHRRETDRYPYYWLEVHFPTEVEGPVCVGRSRSFGMGLFAPYWPEAAEGHERKDG